MSIMTVNDARKTESGIRTIRDLLDNRCDWQGKLPWSFPRLGQQSFTTWSFDEVLDRPLTFAVGDNPYWGTRTPFLIYRDEPRRDMTPTVEINIPVGEGRPNRQIQGCFCQDDDGELVLAHRGKRFTSTPFVITKKTIHPYFSKWLRDVKDDEQSTRVILVGDISPDLVEQIAFFADQVKTLKQIWLRRVRSAKRGRR